MHIYPSSGLSLSQLLLSLTSPIFLPALTSTAGTTSAGTSGTSGAGSSAFSASSSHLTDGASTGNSQTSVGSHRSFSSADLKGRRTLEQRYLNYELGEIAAWSDARKFGLRIVQSLWFESLMLAFVFVSIIFVIVGLSSAAAATSALYIVQILEAIINGFFLLEIVLHVYVHHWRGLFYPWYVLDLLCMAFVFGEQVYAIVTDAPTVMRISSIIRMFRVARAIPLLQRSKFIRDLAMLENVQLLTVTIVRSLTSLAAVFGVIACFMFVTGAISVIVLSEVYPERFSNVVRAMIAFFQMATLDNWFTYYEHMVYELHVNVFTVLFILLFNIIIQQFIFINFFTAVITNNFETSLHKFAEWTEERVRRKESRIRRQELLLQGFKLDKNGAIIGSGSVTGTESGTGTASHMSSIDADDWLQTRTAGETSGTAMGMGESNQGSDFGSSMMSEVESDYGGASVLGAGAGGGSRREALNSSALASVSVLVNRARNNRNATANNTNVDDEDDIPHIRAGASVGWAASVTNPNSEHDTESGAGGAGAGAGRRRVFLSSPTDLGGDLPNQPQAQGQVSRAKRPSLTPTTAAGAPTTTPVMTALSSVSGQGQGPRGAGKARRPRVAAAGGKPVLMYYNNDLLSVTERRLLGMQMTLMAALDSQTEALLLKQQLLDDLVDTGAKISQ